jgi:hypothetical protein
MDVPAPPVWIRRAIAESVHRAVSAFTGGDGFGHCYLYALAGCALARDVLRRDYRLQAGSLRLLAQPPSGWLVLDASGARLEDGRFHSWFGRLGSGDQVAEVVDLSSQHYARWADSNQSLPPNARTPICWDWAADPPNYVWLTSARSSWVGLIADYELTLNYVKSIEKCNVQLARLHRLAREHFCQQRGV